MALGFVQDHSIAGRPMKTPNDFFYADLSPWANSSLYDCVLVCVMAIGTTAPVFDITSWLFAAPSAGPGTPFTLLHTESVNTGSFFRTVYWGYVQIDATMLAALQTGNPAFGGDFIITGAAPTCDVGYAASWGTASKSAETTVLSVQDAIVAVDDSTTTTPVTYNFDTNGAELTFANSLGIGVYGGGFSPLGMGASEDTGTWDATGGTGTYNVVPISGRAATKIGSGVGTGHFTRTYSVADDGGGEVWTATVFTVLHLNEAAAPITPTVGPRYEPKSRRVAAHALPYEVTRKMVQDALGEA